MLSKKQTGDYRSARWREESLCGGSSTWLQTWGCKGYYCSKITTDISLHPIHALVFFPDGTGTGIFSSRSILPDLVGWRKWS